MIDYDISIKKGSDFQQVFTVYDSGNVPRDLTGATINAQMREYSESNDAIDFECSHNGTGGQITIQLTAEQTSAIGYRYGVYDVFITLNGVTEKIINGKTGIVVNVTRIPYLDIGIKGDVLIYTGRALFPAVGKTSRLYLDSANGYLYYWDGTEYQRISFNADVDIEVGETQTLPPGSEATVTIIGTQSHVILNFGIPKGSDIQSIEKAGTIGLVDTYVITLTDGTSHTFTVKNGQDGIDGVDGIGIVSIEKTGTEGVVDTYTITMTDGVEYTFTVTNGQSGVWGSIMGTLANQTDLNTALAGKSDTSHTHGGIEVRPDYTISTTDLTAGTSALATGAVYFVYEA